MPYISTRGEKNATYRRDRELFRGRKTLDGGEQTIKVAALKRGSKLGGGEGEERDRKDGGKWQWDSGR